MSAGTQEGVFARARQTVAQRRLPWKLRWLGYVRPTRPLASLRIISASMRADARLGSLVLHEYGETFMSEALDCCRAAGMRPFLAFGTLLGHQRDHGFIRHDADIDFGLLPDDFAKIPALVRLMERRGFCVRLNDEHEVSFYKPLFPTLFIDFFRFYDKPHAFVYYDTRGDTLYEYAFDREIFRELVPAQFLDRLDTFVPAGTEAFLTASYGDWRTPRERFDNVNDHPNLRVV
jgi:hypothetical protein